MSYKSVEVDVVSEQFDIFEKELFCKHKNNITLVKICLAISLGFSPPSMLDVVADKLQTFDICLTEHHLTNDQAILLLLQHFFPNLKTCLWAVNI